MYTKPIIFKIYSIFIFVVSVTASVAAMIKADYIAKTTAEFLVDLCKSELEAIGGPVSPVQAVYVIALILIILLCVIVLLYSYVEFTAMFSFAKMIEHEKRGSSEPFRRMRLVLPPKFYKVFGKVMFFVPLVLICIAVLGTIIHYSRMKQVFLVLPVIPIIIAALLVILMYITNYCRFNTFGNLLEIKSSEKVSVKTINSLEENKPNTLRVYCVFLYVCCAACLIIAAISLIFTIIEIIGKVSIWSILFIILLYAVTPAMYFIIYGIIGCYYDNLGKMIEHYMIKYKKI